MERKLSVAGAQNAPSLHPSVKSKTTLGKSFRICASCAGSGVGSALLTHLGCIAMPVLAGFSGSAITAQVAPVMLVASPVLAAGITAGIDKLRNSHISAVKIASSAALGFAIAAGIQSYTGHDHHNGTGEIEAKAFLQSLNATERAEFHQTAVLLGKTDLALAAEICVSKPGENAPKAP